MKLRKTIRTTAYSAVLAALVSVLVIIGSTFDMLDLSCAAAASLVIHLCLTEIDAKHAFMIYACAALLSFLAAPMRSCTLYFAAFFGYYPLVRSFLAKHIYCYLPSTTPSCLRCFSCSRAFSAFRMSRRLCMCCCF